MVKNKVFTISVLIILVLQSCDCWIVVYGNIVDSKTEKPIIGAKVEFLNIKSYDYSKSSDSITVNRIFETDSSGHFFMNSNNYGMCPDLEPKIKIWKKGYLSKEYIVKDDAERNELNELVIKLTKK